MGLPLPSVPAANAAVAASADDQPSHDPASLEAEDVSEGVAPRHPRGRVKGVRRRLVGRGLRRSTGLGRPDGSDVATSTTGEAAVPAALAVPAKGTEAA